MRTYSSFRPTSNDVAGLNLPDRQDWFVHPCGTNRDADALTRSNWEVAKEELSRTCQEGDDFEEHRFGHWACGWFEIIIVKPGSAAERIAREAEDSLDSYPVLDEGHFSDLESREAGEVWKECFTVAERIKFARKHSHDLDFDSMSDLMGFIRGRFYSGPTELVLR